MRVFGYFKSTSDQFGLNRGQFRGRDDDMASIVNTGST